MPFQKPEVCTSVISGKGDFLVLFRFDYEISFCFSSFVGKVQVEGGG